MHGAANAPRPWGQRVTLAVLWSPGGDDEQAVGISGRRTFLHQNPLFLERGRDENDSNSKRLWSYSDSSLTCFSPSRRRFTNADALPALSACPNNGLPAQNKPEAHYDSLETTSRLLKNQSAASGFLLKKRFYCPANPVRNGGILFQASRVQLLWLV